MLTLGISSAGWPGQMHGKRNSSDASLWFLIPMVRFNHLKHIQGDAAYIYFIVCLPAALNMNVSICLSGDHAQRPELNGSGN